MVDSLTFLYLPTAISLGALHALEPGHSKTLIAAYLIGTKGTKWDAFLLGISAAATHSVVVIALAAAALWLGSAVFTEQVSHWLQIFSGIMVILLGAWMLWRRWPRSARPELPHHRGAPEPVAITSDLTSGHVNIIDTPQGERMCFVALRTLSGITISVHIARDDGKTEVLTLHPEPEDAARFISDVAPAEPHEFTAELVIVAAGREERRPFIMQESERHHHSHDDLDDDAHARAHAAAMPTYSDQGGRPSIGQVMAFGAAGGMIPYPASVTVMLLALSVGQAAFGLLAVLCFSLGLAVTMVGIGMVVVTGFSQVTKTGRFAALTRQAPILSAILVIGTGLAAMAFSH